MFVWMGVDMLLGVLLFVEVLLCFGNKILFVIYLCDFDFIF